SQQRLGLVRGDKVSARLPFVMANTTPTPTAIREILVAGRGERRLTYAWTITDHNHAHLSWELDEEHHEDVRAPLPWLISDPVCHTQRSSDRPALRFSHWTLPFQRPILPTVFLWKWNTASYLLP